MAAAAWGLGLLEAAEVQVGLLLLVPHWCSGHVIVPVVLLALSHTANVWVVVVLRRYISLVYQVLARHALRTRLTVAASV